MKIRCIAVDDEPLALELIEQNIRAVKEFDLIGCFSSPKKALDFIKENKVDLIFLDIQMPSLTGMQLSREIDPSHQVIFTSAFDHYALESYEVNALDYLLKPIDRSRFNMACQKAIDYFKRTRNGPLDEKLVINSEHEKLLIAPADIIYVEGLKDYVKIHLQSASKPVLTRMNLKTFETTYGSGIFLRIHKSYLINKTKLMSSGTKCITLTGNIELPVGEVYKQDLKALLSGS